VACFMQRYPGTMVTATFRFYEELNDSLTPERREHAFDCACVRAVKLWNMIEALGLLQENRG